MRPGPRTRHAVRRRARPHVADRRRRGRAPAHRHDRHRRAGRPPAGDRRTRRRSRLARGPRDHPVPRVPAEARRGSPLRDRGEGRLRRPQHLRLHPGVRPAPRLDSPAPRPARRPRGHGSAQDHHRLLSRSPLRLRVRGESSRREAGLRDLQRHAGRRRLGRRVGGRHGRRLARLDGRVPNPAVAAPLRAPRHQHVRLRRVA